ncbi:MAG: hypothetical protein K9M54_08515 [Kiritimatiellales bacterium]|nr:hypothetical protein [Kiritimatiellales bacterium]
MGSMMYKQRPAYPALVAAACVMLVGGFLACGLKNRIEDGDGDYSSLLLVGCLSAGLSGTLLIVAFARYQFTHLWKKPDPVPAKRKRHRRKHHTPDPSPASLQRPLTRTTANRK